MKTFLQSEAAECGLVCCAMVASAHDPNVDLFELRRRFSISSKGSTLQSIMAMAGELGFASRPLRVEMEELSQLALPCVLHWDLNHFVVLRKVGRRRATIFDPAVGERVMTLDEVSKHFTGIALEMMPSATFRTIENRPARLTLRRLTGRVRGLTVAIARIVAVALVLEAMSLIAPLFSQFVVDDALSSGDLDLLSVLVLGFGLMLLVQAAVALARSWMLLVLGQFIAFRWKSNLFTHLVNLPIAYFEKRYLGDIVSRFSSVDAIQRTLTGSVIEALLDGVMAIAAFAMMLLYAPSLALVSLCAVVVYGLLRILSYPPLRRAGAERIIEAARENTHFIETLRAITALKLFSKEEARRSRWQNLLAEVQNRDARTTKMTMWLSCANTLIFGLENLLIFWLGARMILASGHLGPNSTPLAPFTIGMLLAFVSYRGQFTGRVSALINHAVDLRLLKLHLERVADIALTAPERHLGGGASDMPSVELDHLPASIELRDVSFRYGDAEPWILRHAHLKIEADSCVALTGASGCGKTTALKIMLGLLSPTEGEVLYGGQPLGRLGLHNVRQQFATVMQEDALLAGTIAQNISFFDTSPRSDKLDECVELSFLRADLAHMPMGLRTIVGDLGSGLSGGQKQRILLARALYKRPAVLALDEATSHLDVWSERAIVAALRKISMTRLVIAHRPETIAAADRVVGMHEGQFVEVGHGAADLGSIHQRPAGAMSPTREAASG